MRVQLPLGVAPFQVIVPLYPVLHAHAVPAALLEFAMLHGAAVETDKEVCIVLNVHNESFAATVL